MPGIICVRQSSKRSAQNPCVHWTSLRPTGRTVADGLVSVSARTRTQTKVNIANKTVIRPIVRPRQNPFWIEARSAALCEPPAAALSNNPACRGSVCDRRRAPIRLFSGGVISLGSRPDCSFLRQPNYGRIWQFDLAAGTDELLLHMRRKFVALILGHFAGPGIHHDHAVGAGLFR